MPDFPNPFSGNVPEGKMNFNELIRAIRLDIAGELEAIHLYTAHAEATDNELVKELARKAMERFSSRSSWAAA